MGQKLSVLVDLYLVWFGLSNCIVTRLTFQRKSGVKIELDEKGFALLREEDIVTIATRDPMITWLPGCFFLYLLFPFSLRLYVFTSTSEVQRDVFALHFCARGGHGVELYCQDVRQCVAPPPAGGGILPHIATHPYFSWFSGGFGKKRQKQVS